MAVDVGIVGPIGTIGAVRSAESAQQVISRAIHRHVLLRGVQVPQRGAVEPNLAQ